MIHIFDTDIAEKYGVNSAIILQNIGYWIKQNEANQINYFDGNYWTFNSRRAYQKLFPYMSKRQIETAFEKLINEGLIITGNYNKIAYDRTLWYALTQKGKCILHFGEMDCLNMVNGLPSNVQPIPNINTDITTNLNADVNKLTKETRFIPPTLEQVQNYCNERNNNVDAERFIDHYTANGWKVGKTKMQDWKAAVRTWEKNSFSKPEQTQTTGNIFLDLIKEGVLDE